MTIEIRGHSVPHLPTSPLQVCVAFLTDFALAVALYVFFSVVFFFSPVPFSDGSGWPVWLGIASFWGFLSLLGRATPGMRTQRVRYTRGAWLRNGPAGLARALILPGSILLSVCVASFWHPIAGTPESRMLEARLPSSLGDWTVAPFFYALGAWPKTYQGTQVLPELGYARGVPHRFVPEIRMTWESPALVLQLEGPKTPEGVDVNRLRECFSPGSSALFCAGARSRVLGKAFKEMRGGAILSQWRLAWFEVKSPLPEKSRPQGVWIENQTGSTEEIRVFLLTPAGALQGISLKSSQGDIPPAARIAFQDLIAGLRVESSLDSGKAWINRELLRTRLDALSKIPAGQFEKFVDQLTEIQIRLLAKVSVDPTIEAFYHLGGVSILMLQRLRDLEKSQPGLAAAQYSNRTAAARRLVWASAQYAQDIDAKNWMSKKLLELWEEAKRY